MSTNYYKKISKNIETIVLTIFFLLYIFLVNNALNKNITKTIVSKNNTILNIKDSKSKTW